MGNSYLAPDLRGFECATKGGRGVVACGRIVAGTLLVVWGGNVLTRDEIRLLPAQEIPLVLQVDDDAYLVTTDPGPADWVNHSCSPNAGLRGQISLVALRTIKAGEEVCFDYGMSDGSDYDEFDCECGTSHCRGRVTGDDWRRPELVARYGGHFSPYLERRIAASDRTFDDEAARRGRQPRYRATPARRLQLHGNSTEA